MPRFAYAAIDATGASVQGITKAGTIGEARSHLLDKQLYPVKIEEHRGKLQIDLTKQKVKKKSLMHFTRQLAVFVKAGIPLTDALETIGDAMVAATPLHRLGGPEDLKGAAALFCSNAGQHISGQILAIDGGMTAI